MTMSSTRKAALLILGFLAAILIVAQLVLALQILGGAGPGVRKAHQHSGYLMVAVALTYVALSLATIAGLPTRQDRD